MIFRILFLSAFVGVVCAQSPGGLHGSVTDTTGAVVPNAVVNVGSAAVKAQDDGSWSVTLPAGDYPVRVEFPGFNRFDGTATVAAGRVTEFPIQLTVEAGKQEVTVSAGPAELSLDPGNNASGSVVSGSNLDALPDDPDDMLDMLTQLAGPSAAGSSALQILLDGFSNGQLPAKAAIKEIRVSQNPFSADYDNLGFGRVEIVTKPGADQLRGTLGFTDSDAIFNSRNPYAENKAAYRNQILTSNIAGPIGHHAASYNLNFQRNIINNTALINAVTLEGPVQQTVLTPRTDLDFNGRLDDQINAANTITGTYRYYRSDRENNGIGGYNLTSREYPSLMNRNEVRLTETAIVNPSTVNESRFAYTRNDTVQNGTTADPAIVVSGSFVGGSAQVGAASNLNQLYELQNNTTVAHGKHTFKFGVRGRYNSISDITPGNFGGTFSFFGVTGAPDLDGSGGVEDISSLEQYRRTLLGLPGGGASQFSINAGNPLAKVSESDLGVYVLDDWRVTDKITVSLGLRYEIQTDIHDPNDWGPRLGVAYQLTPKTIVRIGGGIFYNRVGLNFILPTAHFNGHTEEQFVVNNPTFFPNIPSIATLGAMGEPQSIYELDPKARAQYGIGESVTIERQLPGNTTFAWTWLNSQGRHNMVMLNINTPLPGTYNPAVPTSGVRPYGDAAGNIFQYESVGDFNQHQFWMAINNHLNKRVSFTVNYSYFKFLDDFTMGPPSDPYDLKLDYGRPAWARTSNFSLLGTFLLPGKVEVNPFFLVSSGAPYDLTIGTDLYGTTVANARPAFATDLSRPSVVITKFGAFDTDPIAGQTIVPRDYLMGSAMWNLNMRVGRTFTRDRYKLNFNVDVNNVFNHLNQGGWVGNLSSPLFGESTAINLFRDTSNNRRVQLGTLFTF